MKKILTTVLTLAAAHAIAQYTPGLKLVGTTSFDGPGWFTSTSNGRFMMVADGGGGCSFISVSNKTDPVLIVKIEGGGYSYGTETYGDAFYVSTSDGALRVFDASDPEGPTLTDQINAGMSGKLEIYDGLLFAVGGVNGHGTVDIYSLADPYHPSRISRFSGFASFGLGDVAKKGNYLYVANYFNRSVDVLNISNLASPVLVDTQPVQDHGDPFGFEPWKAHVKDNALWIMDDGYWQIFDITVPSMPAFVKSIYAATDIEGGFLVDDIFVWAASGVHNGAEAGLYFYNCVDPFNPVFMDKAPGYGGGFYFKADRNYAYYSRAGSDISIYTMPQLISAAASTVSLASDGVNTTVTVNGSYDRTYLLQQSTDMLTWQDIGLVPEGVPVGVTNGIDKVFFRSLSQ